MNILRNGLIGPTVFLLIFFHAFPAYAFRCGNQLISEGDSTSKVLAACGQPDNVVLYDGGFASEFQQPYPEAVENRFYRSPPENQISVEVEEWMYNPGPTEFVRYLYIEDDIVKRITTGERGY